jgi:hypothetical protein
VNGLACDLLLLGQILRVGIPFTPACRYNCVETQSEFAKEGQMNATKVDAIKAHDILRDALVDQTDSIIKRMAMLVTGNSILLASFFVAANSQYFAWARYLLPIVGILFSIAFGVVMGVGAHTTAKLADTLADLEGEKEFEYLRIHKARLELDIGGWTKKGLNPRRIGCYLSPFVSIGPIIIWAWLLR